MTRDRHLFVILGATGDLAARKLLPALHRLLPPGAGHVLGAAGAPLDDTAFREWTVRCLADAGVDRTEAAAWADTTVSYQPVPREGPLDDLARRVAVLDNEHRLGGNRVLYLALPPAAFGTTIERLGAAGLAASSGWTRVVVEKPFGHDLESARQLNATVGRHFSEDQVFRIDHYLGKETVQNLLVFRFANPVFEGSWNRDRVERIEITVAESRDVAGRGAFYDRTGAVADMMQSHLLQVLTLVAMEPPVRLDSDGVRAEKVKVLRAISGIPSTAVRLGQYGGGTVEGVPVEPYRDADGVAPGSTTPTFAAARVLIDTWRWQGVPFLLRTGKAMARRTTEVAVRFRRPPVCLFHGTVDDCVDASDLLRLTLQPDEGFSLEVDVKEPAASTRLHPIRLRFSYADEFGPIPDAYETLLGDIVEGDQTLFVRRDEVEEAWRLFSPLIGPDLPVHPYPAGSWGPDAADELLPAGARWATGD